MRLSDKAQAALNRVVEQFKAGDLSPIVRVARIQRRGEPIPAEKWSLSNRIMAYIQTGDLDCRGYRQWQRVNRYVVKGARAAYILVPLLKTVVDEETGRERQRLCGFKTTSVFGLSQTDGEDLPEYDYEPAEMPPLMDVARRMGLDVSYQPLPEDRLGDIDKGGTQVRLGTYDVNTFFHELAHAAHARLNGGLKGGQDPQQETVAEFTAAVLMRMYGMGDRSGNCWEYIKGYADDPIMAIVKALSTVEKVLALLLDKGDDA